MLVVLYYIGRFLQLLGMSVLLFSIVDAGPMGPSPRAFGVGIGCFLAGYVLVRFRLRGDS